MPRQSRAKKRKSELPVKLDDSDIPEERFFLDPNSVSEHLYCSICQEVYDEPWRAPCGHSYCKKCIAQWLSNGQKTCPEDRQHLTWDKMHKDFIVENIIGDYQVACPWRPLGCENIGPLHLLKGHKENCPLNPKQMPKAMRDYSKEVLNAATSASLLPGVTPLQPIKKANVTENDCDSNVSTTTSMPKLGSTGSSLLDKLIAQAEEEERQNGAVTTAEEHPSTSYKPGSSANTVAADVPSSSCNVSNSVNTKGVFDSDDETDEAVTSAVPEAGVPSLRMRLYMSEKRDQLCTFLEGPSSAEQSSNSAGSGKKTSKKN